MELGILGGLAYLGSNYESVNEEKQISSNYHPINLIYNNDNNEKNLKKNGKKTEGRQVKQRGRTLKKT